MCTSHPSGSSSRFTALVFAPEKYLVAIVVQSNDRSLACNDHPSGGSVDRLVNWCNGDEERIQTVAGAIEPYSTVDLE